MMRYDSRNYDDPMTAFFLTLIIGIPMAVCIFSAASNLVWAAGFFIAALIIMMAVFCSSVVIAWPILVAVVSCFPALKPRL